MANDVGRELLNVPFADMVKSMAMGIAKAQFELDSMAVRIAQMMSGESFTIEEPDSKGVMQSREVKGTKITFFGKECSMLELGFTPSFYQFVDTIIEVKMSISMTSESESKNSSTKASAAIGWFGVGGGASVSTVSASYASKFQYHAEGASLLRTKLVPVPPPAILEERIRTHFEQKAAAEG